MLLNLLIEISSNLVKIHKLNYIYLGINFDSIYYDQSANKVRFSNYSNSVLLPKGKEQMVTTMRINEFISAPETKGNVVSKKTDIYSLGILILSILQ